MKIFYGVKDIKKEYFKRPVACIGVFDGVHAGHRDIISGTRELALRLKTKSVVVTFYPHPLKVLAPSERVGLLISLSHRLKLIEELGIDCCIVVNFNKRLAAQGPRSFVKNLLVNIIGIKGLVVGSDFMFGKEKSGDIYLLKTLGEIYGFSVKVMRLKKYKGNAISSSRIRNLIEKGMLKEARRLLGRPVSILGTVIKGTSRGRLIGYPTANIDPHHEIIPPKGVYAVTVRAEGKPYKGILNIGIRPTFEKEKRKRKKEKGVLTVEVHIFKFSNNIYGKDIEVNFLKRIRKERRFSDKDSLVHQIRRDEIIAGQILG